MFGNSVSRFLLGIIMPSVMIMRIFHMTKEVQKLDEDVAICTVHPG